MPIVKIKEKFQVTIPNETRRKIHLEIGDILEVVTKDNLIILKPKAVVDRVDVETAINEGLKDIEDGRVYGPFGSAGEMLHSLHKNAKKLKAK